MILLDDVVQVFDLADFDVRFMLFVIASIAAALAPLLSIVIFSGAP